MVQLVGGVDQHPLHIGLVLVREPFGVVHVGADGLEHQHIEAGKLLAQLRRGFLGELRVVQLVGVGGAAHGPDHVEAGADQ